MFAKKCLVQFKSHCRSTLPTIDFHILEDLFEKLTEF